MTSLRKLKTQAQSKKVQEEVRMRVAEQRVEDRGELLGGAGCEEEPYGMGKIKKYRESIESMKTGGKTGVGLVPFGKKRWAWDQAINSSTNCST